jgi:putative transposase
VRPKPGTIKTDNGGEFISKAMDRWADEHGVELDFSRPGKPTDNVKVESFDGRFCDKCLNAHWFLSLADAQRKITACASTMTKRVHAPYWGGRHPPNSPTRGRSPQSTVSTEPEISNSDRY